MMAKCAKLLVVCDKHYGFLSQMELIHFFHSGCFKHFKQLLIHNAMSMAENKAWWRLQFSDDKWGRSTI